MHMYNVVRSILSTKSEFKDDAIALTKHSLTLPNLHGSEDDQEMANNIVQSNPHVARKI